VPDIITSPSNPRVAALRSLHTAKGRAEAGAFLVEGPHLLDATLDAGVVPSLVLFAPEALQRTPAGRRLIGRLEAVREDGAEVLEATVPVVARAADTQTPQGVVASVPADAVAPERVRARRRGRARPLVLLLDALADPGNVGTLLRTALAADVDEVWLSPGSADPLAPKVVRAASGASFHLPVRADLPWDEIGRRLEGAPRVHQVVLAEASGATAYDDLDLTQRTVLIVGNEAHGPSREAQRLATTRVNIPMWNKVESLNAAVAASVILFEAGRQRRAHERQQHPPATTERVDGQSAQGGEATD
jgi:RNA methyltransferase, TrmH family